jgi:signal recognition particle receptor subunit alpha
MIDLFCIFTTGGLILWCKTFLNMKFDAVLNNLIKNVLLDDKRTQETYVANGLVMRWRIMNEAGLIFVVAYQEAYNVLYSDKLLDLVVQDFTTNELPKLKKAGKVYMDNPTYTEAFMKLLRKWESYCQNQLETAKFTSNDYKKKKSEIATGSGSGNKTTPFDKKEEFDSVIENFTQNINSPTKEATNPTPSRYSNIPKKSLLGRQSAPTSRKSEGKSAPSKKEGRVWEGQFSEVNKENLDKYDRSTPGKSGEVDIEPRKSIFEGKADPDNLDDRSIDENMSDREDEEVDTSTNAKKKGGLFSRLTSSLKNYIGNKVLTEEDLEKVMNEFSNMLMEKNVAKEIAENLCNSVSKSLLNTKTQSFTSIAATVKSALKETIAKILTPKQEFDVLKQALAARKRGEPYKIVFIGVNGVGKSTNLAKVGYLLMNNGLKILIAACDNFRSGAVEQLKTHSRVLGVDLYEKGYKDDPAYICKEAVEEARKKGYDCVLIDTAGRMQDNEPLMKSLAKLVEINQPDAILFVGEALTGNDSVDQLKKFNQALIDNSKKENPRTIDGILLTKFDTVDDKVGAALTMVYTTGKPVVYVGTGQKYTNLKKLNVNHVLNALFG